MKFISIRSFSRNVLKVFAANGIQPLLAVRLLTHLPRFISEVFRFNQLCSDHDKHIEFSFYPILSDYNDNSGFAKGHYFWQDLIVAQRVFASQPLNHLDVGSRIDGFVAHIATFMPLDVLDIRPLSTYIPNVTFKCGSLLSYSTRHSYSSISCLHVLEHIGLGRYSDPINGKSFYDGLNSLFDLLELGGNLYISFPVGKPAIYFNAHRVLSLPSVLNYIQDTLQPSSLELIGFINDEGSLVDTKDHDPDYFCNLSSNSLYACVVLQIQK